MRITSVQALRNAAPSRWTIAFEPRPSPAPAWARALATAIAVAAALVLGGLFFAAAGHSPLHLYGSMARGIVGDFYAFSETIVKAIPLALAGLGVAVAFRIGFWNIGAEGQLYAGAIAATAIPLFFPSLSSFVMLTMMMFVAALAGGALAVLAALPRLYRNVNEIITSLMLNYVVILFADYLIYGPWKDPQSFNFPLTPLYPRAAHLPTFFGTRMHAGILLVLIAAAALDLLMRRSRWGFELRLLGDSPSAARFVGLSPVRHILVAMIVSGGLAGLAGMTEVAGILHRLQRELSPGYGYSAIIVAWLARLHPWGVVPMSVFLGAVFVGGYSLQAAGLASASVFMLQGGMLFVVLIADVLLEHRLILRRTGRS